ncbi:kelch repeat-containing protein [Gangjinia marincola]|uniref:Kelch repeat-containing protein n=1 Tax=Gangjinia marincola TaxID=578463 RepID=A0ABP3XWX7_9FLAO
MILTSVTSCNDDDEDEDIIGNWEDRSVYDGAPRSSAVVFTINNKAYVGTGYDGDDRLSDFWIYDIENDFWEPTPITNFPGSARSSAVAFSVNGKGYVGLGFDGDNELGDFYEYNPSSNTWSEIAEFPGGTRRGAIAFESLSFGYVGTGFDGDNDRKDFYRYNPSTNSWSIVAGYGGNKRRDASTFIIGNTVYVGAGSSNGLVLNDFWSFDLESSEWNRLNDLDDDDDDFVVRAGGVGFAINGKGYFATGNTGNGITSSVWEYDPMTEDWKEKTAYEGVPREDAVALYTQERAFIALGRSGGLYLDDNHEFFPLEEEDEDD